MATLASPSLQSLLRGVRLMLNQPNPLNSFWGDDELTSYINEAGRIYFAEVIASHPEGQFDTNTTLAITAATRTVALPADCYRVKTLYRISGSERIPLNYRQNFNNSWTTSAASSAGYFPEYEFEGNNLVLRDTPNFTDATGLYLEYTAFPSTLVDGGDVQTARISPIFRQVIEMYAVYKAKVKESLVNGVVVHAVAKEHLNDLYVQFQAAISPRSLSPQYVQPFNPEF